MVERLNLDHSEINGGTVFDDVTKWPWRARKWLSETPFSNPELLARHLRAGGIDRDSFIAACKVATRELYESAPIPAWAHSLEGYACEAEGGIHEGEYPIRGFAAAAAPIIRTVIPRLRSTIASLKGDFPDVPLDAPSLESILLDQLITTQVLPRVTRCMILEMHLAKTQEQSSGSSDLHFRNFVRDFVENPRRQVRFLRDYPVLARGLLECADNWVSFTHEILVRWCADYCAIGRGLSSTRPGAITSMRFGVGDTHRRGRSVVVLQTDLGLRIVYKPRPVDVEKHYSELLDWLNTRGITPRFRVPRIITRNGYGWWEYVEHQECKSSRQVGRFYQRLGGHLALLHVLDGVDMHLENIVAAGEHPVIVDLEGLFHPRQEITNSEREVERAASQAVARTVLRVGLLPQTGGAAFGSGQSYEISGVGGKAGQIAPHSILQYEAPATDEMRAILKPQVLEGSRNRPRLCGKDVEPTDFHECFTAGFERTYRLLTHNKRRLLAPAGPIRSFASDEVRAILRPTRSYAKLAVSSLHPDFLQNAIDQDRLFDRLWDGFADSESRSELIRAEKVDLSHGDIPIFASRPQSTSIWTSTGQEIRGFFPEPAFNVVRSRIQSLHPEDLARQLWFVQASLATLATGSDPRPITKVRTNRRYSRGQEARSFLEEAMCIGDRLVALALHVGDAASWVGVSLRQDGIWAVGPVPANLYSGSIGIALFLAHLGRITRGDRYTSLAKKAIDPLIRELEGSADHITTPRSLHASLGGLEGLGGYIYALTHFGVIWDEPAYLDLAERLATSVKEILPTDDKLDVLAGSAGNLLGLLALYAIRPSSSTFGAAAACAEHLLARASESGSGVAWNTHLKSAKPLLGFAHGASGIALSLVRFGDLSKDRRFSDLGMRALDYERGELLLTPGTWPDYRTWSQPRQGDGANTICAWCHGAAGGALARLGISRIAPSEQLLLDLKSAIRITEEGGFAGNSCLCHGSLGNLEVLVEAAKQESLTTFDASDVASSILRRKGARAWECGAPLGVETPDLMTGIAGIGYALLRFAHTSQVPCLLLLDPPLR